MSVTGKRTAVLRTSTEFLVGRYAYDGGCADSGYHSTFTLGIYPIVKGSKGPKRGKVEFRVVASKGELKLASDVAELACRCLEAGVGLPRKRLRASLETADLLRDRLPKAGFRAIPLRRKARTGERS